MNTILEDQKKKRAKEILFAQRMAYKKSKRVYLLEGAIILSAFIGTIFITFDFPGRDGLALGNFFVAIIILVLGSFFSKQTKLGANFQELFDIELYKIYPNETLVGKSEQIHHHFAPSEIKYDNEDDTWYSKNISPKVPHELAILLCMKCNTLFGLSQRKKYRNLLRYILIGYYAISIVLALIFRPDIYSFILYLSPSLPFLTLMTNKIKNHSEVLSRYIDIDNLLQNHFVNYDKNDELPVENQIRALQDLIYLNRVIPVKIPELYYERHRKKTNSDVDSIIADLVEQILKKAPNN